MRDIVIIVIVFSCIKGVAGNSYTTVLDKLKNLSETLRKNLLILIDIGDLADSIDYLRLVREVVTRCGDSKIVVATSSGGGAFTNKPVWRQIFSMISVYKTCRMLNFSHNEVNQYLKDSKADVSNMEKIKQLTCYNPYLLKLLWHHGLMAESSFHRFSYLYQVKHVNSIVKDMGIYESLPHFCRQNLKSLYDWGCKADNEIPSDINELPKFSTSWAAQHHILCYQKSVDGKKFVVLTALPCFNMLLTEIISKLSESQSIPDVPLVHGFFYEDQFFSMVTSPTSIAVHSETKAMTVEISCVSTEEIKEDMSLGVLYHLRYTYPIIDGIGYLKVNETPSIIFVQISLSEYKHHSTKLKDLSEYQAPEDKSKTILQYYRSKVCSKRNIQLLYLYVSPHTLLKTKAYKKKVGASSTNPSSNVGFVQYQFNYRDKNKV